MLIAVDDSVGSLEAARVGAQLAAHWGAVVRVIHAIPDGAIAESAQGLLDHVVGEVRASGIPGERVDAVLRKGEPFRCILDEVRVWNAGLIVMAISDRRGLRSDYIGSATEHVLEFTECPVLVVPARTKP